MNPLLAQMTTGPLASLIAPYLASGDDSAIHNLATSKTFIKYDWISVADFNTWCASNNAEFVNIQNVAATPSSPYYSAANSLLRCLNGAVNAGAINLGSSTVTALLNAWPFVDTTGTAKNSLIALGTFPASQADLTGLDWSIPSIAVARLGG
jgi:hypothetical protein